MKLSELQGKLVVEVATARKAGNVEDALVSPSHDSVNALVVKVAQQGPSRILSTQSLGAIGPDAVTVESAELLRPAEQVPELAGLASLASVIGSRVLTSDGKVLGAISDVTFDPSSYSVLSYEYKPSGLKSRLKGRSSVAPGDIIRLGTGMVTVKTVQPSSRAA
jgi:uncharacterized protein YrrD